jgi:hypothetical protein
LPGKGDWNDGQRSFMDPLPVGSYIVVQVKVSIVGRFNCDGLESGATVSVILGGDSVASSIELPRNPSDCLCPNCVVTFNATSDFHESGWKYNHGGFNTLMILPNDGPNSHLCVHWVDITLIYTGDNVNPDFVSILPRGGITDGGTNLLIIGGRAKSADFCPRIQYKCLFDGTLATDAHVMFHNQMNCTAPPHLESLVDLAILIAVNNQTILTGYQFRYYSKSLFF